MDQAKPSNDSAIIPKAAASLGYALKLEQERSLQKFVAGEDIFVSLPTGFGKSLCYILLPRIYDFMRVLEIVNCISRVTLNSLDEGSSCFIWAHCLSKKSTTSAVRAGIKKGEFQIVFISPETLSLSTEWRSVLSSEIYGWIHH